VKRGLLLDTIVGQGAAILQLLPCEDEALLVWRDACNNCAQSKPTIKSSTSSGELINPKDKKTRHAHAQFAQQDDPN